VEKFIIPQRHLPEDLQIFYADDAGNDSKLLSALNGDFGVRTAVALPLRSRNAIIGFMVLPSNIHRNFSGEDRRLLANISSQVGIAIESAHLYEKSQRLARQMSALFEVGKTISSQLELQPLLASIAENAGKFLDADHTSVVCLIPSTGQMYRMVEWNAE